ncbi:Spy0128 family protein [Oceanobacillus indicireducens]|uniref:Gram-positive cocci surface proteins LPxTG domain-containing protein n=1 Tax=Oceanobacillus indicireducens TaxID=1004261 RepID=A0A917XSP3_9BACI|nr:FctA domain-containing protein [Oceanobacillus indicireducens]GGN50502.1 hypothetical protein GCM10007971_04150 [Oceanobacillus indicireducens]
MSRKTGSRISVLFAVMLLFQTLLSSFAYPVQVFATGYDDSVFTGISAEETGEQQDSEHGTVELVDVQINWSIEHLEIESGDTDSIKLSDDLSIDADQTGRLLTEDGVDIGEYTATTNNTVAVTFEETAEEYPDSKGVFVVGAMKPHVESEEPEDESDKAAETEGDEESTGENDEDAVSDEGVSDEAESVTEEEAAEESVDEEEAVEGEETEESEQSVKSSKASLEENLITDFVLFYTTKDGSKVPIENGAEIEVDLSDLNAVSLDYSLIKPDEVDISAGDTYTIPLPAIAYGIAADNQPITINGDTVATYSIIDNQIVITFNESVNNYDNVEMHVNLSGSFNTEVFETEEEVVIEVPYREGNSFTATIRAERQEYDGEDKKEAGSPYILDENGEKVPVDRNPEFIDWTVRANDSMGSYENATIIDDLGANLEIVKDSFVVYQIIRNYKNEEIDRVKLDDVAPRITDSGFELNLGAIEDAYEITYTTRVTRPGGGGTHTINNDARIVLDGDENEVKDSFTGTWSGDIPTLEKSGNISNANADMIEWQVKYNYGQEELGSDVILTDTLTHGEVILDSVRVVEVKTDIDGNVIEEIRSIEVEAVLDDNGNLMIPGLDANGRAYNITFQSTLPLGLNDETVTNTIEDNYNNKDDASVTVNTIPTGGKFGEQLVDDEGNPYIQWTITMNSRKVDISNINVKDVFSKEHLKFDAADTSLYELYKDGVEVENYSVTDYTHDDGRIGFHLQVTDAGPHEYKFVYRTYYTEDGMKEPHLANDAELIFDDGTGEGIGVDVDYEQDGPKAGISKSGKYVLNEEGLQEIEWTITFNNSRILLDNPVIEDIFTSKNYTYVNDSLSMTENGEPFTDYEIEGPTSAGFTLKIKKNTNAVYAITYRTTADDAKNEDQRNDVELTWQGGTEKANATVGKRHPGMNKSGKVVINDDGTKSVNWTVNFNTNRHVIHNFELTDTNLPNTVEVSNIKVTTNGEDVTDQFAISEPKDGQFTVSIAKLDAVPYQLTYSTALSATEEAQEVKNTAAITYTGGSDSKTATIPNPELGVQKEAVGQVEKSETGDLINWKITANTDTAKHLVNLVNPVLTDEIPSDQKLVASSIKVMRTGTEEDIAGTLKIDEKDNEFTINLPDGPYQYIVTFQTEILEYPSVNDKIDRYTNTTTLSNDGYKDVSANAYIDYFADGTNNNNAKTGAVNEDTENIDWEATVNPLGLTINNAVITDELSKNQTYVIDDNHEISVMNNAGEPLDGNKYKLTIGEGNRSFIITFTDPLTESVKVTYSTRLNPELIGSYDVTNDITLTGGQSVKELSKKTESITTSQWFYGGGGSGRTVNFELNKENTDGNPLENVEFKLERVDINNNVIPVNAEIVTDENGGYESGKIRAGRYILTEKEAPEGFKLLDPIYFAIGYSKSGVEGEYTVTFMNSDWKEAENKNATAEGNKITVINDYEPVPVTLAASKKLEGIKELEDGLFTFKLKDSDDKVIDTKTNDASGNVIFDELTFDKVGEYTYSIQEEKGNLAGVTYDKTVYEVTVKVDTDSDGKLAADISYEEDIRFPEFTNTYKADPVNVELEANKSLHGLTLSEDQFEFELVDESNDVIQTVKNDAEGNVTFEPIKYDTEGKHVYIIREVESKLKGIISDDKEYLVTVTVTDNLEGKLEANVNYMNGPAGFTNTYTPEPDSVVFEASKILKGKTLENNQFDFELVDETGNVLQTTSNNAEGQVIFDEITFDETGEHTYTIREAQGDLGGVTYDSSKFTFKVTVEDNEKGNLVATVEEIDGPAVFTNSYETAPGSIVLEANKILEGQNLRNDQFEFELVDESGEVLQTVKNNAAGQVIFDEITYEEVGDYEYTIREVEGTQLGVTYDQSEINVTVNVSDDGEGKLVAVASYDKPAAFSNSYTPEPGSVVLEANKELNGQKLVNGQFSFELVDESGEVVQTVTSNADGQVIFDEIDYEATGTHTYIIREAEGTQGGMTYDQKTYTVVVNVTDDEGQLVATPNYIGGPAVFTNNYEADPDRVVVEAKKILEGQNLVKDQFTFQLLNESEEVIQTTTNNADGQVIFDEMVFDEVGVYHFSIREVEGTQGGITYDSTVYNISVDVVDGREGQLIATVNYIDGPAEFKNVYTPNPDSIVIEAEKILEGQNLRKGQFEFELVDESGKVLQTVKNNADGQVTFDEITYEEVGEHKYTIREVKGVQGGVTYDSTKFEVTVTVTDDGIGQLTATLDAGDESLLFTNTYVPAPDSVVFEAEKILEGQDLVTEQFEFELVDESGKVVQTTTNNAEGQVIFDEITYDAVGEHRYTIREIKGVQGGVEYDTSEFEVTVTVTDDGAGQLTATEDYTNGPAVFTNKYSTASVSVKFEAEKVLGGRYTALEANEFTFEVLDVEGTVVSKGTNNADGVIEFETIEFDNVGSYEFTIREVAGDDKDINYDETVYNVVVEVADNGEGQLVAELTYTEKPIFTNEYDPRKVSVGDYVWIDENKDGLQDETDTPLEGVVLTIEDEDGSPVTDVYGEPVGPQTTDENGYYSFDNLPVDKTYKVRIDREASAEALKGLEPTLEEVGDDNSVDSSTWEATSRHLTEEGYRDPTLDFGFIRPSVSVGDYVWFDQNKDGLQDKTDIPIKGVVLTIEDEEGNPVTDVYGNTVEPTVTDENGYYIFENLPIDHTYTVRIDQEASREVLKEYVPTLHEVGDDRAIDSSTWEATSRHLTKDGEHDPTLDFGFVKKVIEVSGTKTWEDASNQDGIRPDSITVNLLANGKQVDSVEVTAGNDWSYEFSDLPKYENGVEIVYTITENTVTDYTQEIDDFDITNHYTPGETAVTVTKHWDDADNQDGKRLDAIKVQLTANSDPVGDPVELLEENNWTHTWTELDEKAAGETIVYSVIELTDAEDYVTEVNDENHGNIIITNSYTPETIDISGEKTWLDGDNQAKDRPEEITVNLLANGEVVASMNATEAEDWSYQFTDLPKYSAGKEIIYTIEEVPVEGYETIIDGYNITNLRVGTIDVEGVKTWVGDSEEVRPESITVHLLQNNVVIDTKEVTVTDDWKYSFTDLPAFDEEGATYVYTIEEEAVKDYETTVNGYDITNTYTVEVEEGAEDPKDGEDKDKTPGTPVGKEDKETSAGVERTDSDSGKGSKLPRTATNIFNLLAIGIALIVLAAAITIYRRRKSA